eukprot:COSAG01_NODE_1579_length_9829_cov_17.910997_3_plen_147_part_00
MVNGAASKANSNGMSSDDGCGGGHDHGGVVGASPQPQPQQPQPQPLACGQCGWQQQLQGTTLLFLVPFLNEVKDSWEFAAVPLHFLAQGWPIWLWGATIAVCVPRPPPNLHTAMCCFRPWCPIPPPLTSPSAPRPPHATEQRSRGC